ncbi:hypothetical protein [Bosea sp. 685]|uniref:hypothetical protein n=1 Tax=Bosea sp. 685 TaxID=3080057 RepID=UPI00289342B7|nr:hypothetical protein [Bosea sp. 685]WNJ89229.1 hypothetical protein RMR04_22840 [Bosea sp. 685]
MSLIDENDPVQSVFAPVLGLPAWSVQKGQGSMLTFEFGNPSLYIREPIETKEAASAKIVAWRRRRTVKPIGEWWLWIYCCNWRCIVRGREAAHSESTSKRIGSAARELDGQRLLSISVDPLKGTSRFAFDLGAVLETWPYEDEDLDEQWWLQHRSSYTFAYRKDGRYSWSAERSGEEVWLPLPSGATGIVA